jgi:hypothetical protein
MVRDVKRCQSPLSGRTEPTHSPGMSQLFRFLTMLVSVLCIALRTEADISGPCEAFS